MKKRISVVLVALSLLFALRNPMPVLAMETRTPISVEYFEDGTYEETYIEEFPCYARSQTKSGKKTVVKKAENGDKLWSVTVTGSFTYGGTSAKCTSAKVSTESFDSYWKKYSSSSSKSGATATASAVFKKYRGSIVVDSMSGKVALTCSSSGKLS